MTKYGDFLVINHEGEGIVGQFKTLAAARKFALAYEPKWHTNVSIAREVAW